MPSMIWRYRTERPLDELQMRRSRSRRRRSSSSLRDRCRREELRRDDRDRRDDRYEPRRDDRLRIRRDPRDIDREDHLRMDSRSRVRERSTRADHHNKIGRTARWGRDIAPEEPHPLRVEKARSASSFYRRILHLRTSRQLHRQLSPQQRLQVRRGPLPWVAVSGAPRRSHM